MNGNCIDIGIIQAFLDGETVPETSLKVSRHVAGCNDCAALLAQAEEENSLVFSVLDRELNTLVPTQRLWSRINESIAVEKSRISVWQRLMSFVTANLANPSFAAAAGIVLVLGMVAVVLSLRSSGNQQANVASDVPKVHETEKDQPELTFVNFPPPDSQPIASPPSRLRVTQANLSDDELERLARRANAERQPRPQYLADRYLPGEESYIKTISDLEQNTQSNSEIPASSQVAYQRDLAVVDDAITKMKQVVKKNPRNQAAKQVLYSSYQDKIDLLNSVAQREELMASLSSQ